MKKTILFFVAIFLLLFNNVKSKELSNNVIASIDNSIITELDLNKEINLIKFITKSQDNSSLKSQSLQNLIDRKIKNIESDNLKVDVTEQEVEINLYNYLTNKKINTEELNVFFKQHEIEDDYLKNIIKTDMRWSKLIQNTYANRVNVNLTEIDKEISKESGNSTDNEKLKNELIFSERNVLLNKIAASHLEKRKKKYLIKIL
jgi:uncharacterized protein YihD (DUF1040 family)